MFAALFVLVAVVALLYRARGYLAFVVGGALTLGLWAVTGVGSPMFFVLSLAAFVGAAVVFGRGDLRQRLVTARVMPIVAKLLPRLGDTERIALEAGTVWWDGELFSGRPDWREAARLRGRAALAGGAGLPRRPRREALRDARRLGDPAAAATCPRRSGASSRRSASSA